MSTQVSEQVLRVALIGNPNTGKSTIFNALCGARQRVGNYPGVTVEKRLGRFSQQGRRVEVIDLPGTYSLSPRSPDEMVAVDVMLARRDDTPAVDAVVCVVDASNLQRNLYLVSQVLELGLPTVVALNMTDVAAARGIDIDGDRLGERIGVRIVPTEASRGRGIDQLKATLVEVAQSHTPATQRANVFPETFRDEVDQLERRFANGTSSSVVPRYLVERLLLDANGYVESTLMAGHGDLRPELTAARGRLAEAGVPVPAVEAVSRYRWVEQVLDGAVTRAEVRQRSLSDRIDRVLTHRVWGTLAFALLMLLIFQAVFSWAGPAMDLIDGALAATSDWLSALLPPGMLQSLVVDGIVAGVGAVIIFLPQIMILFFFIGVLEDCGYMARAAYLMDRLMVRVGLSGRSFIPMLSSFACAIPGIMATRVIDHRNDRLTTIMVAPLMSCSARLPVYTLLIGAFIPARHVLGGVLNVQGLTMAGMYLLGIIVAVVVALVLKRSVFGGVTPPFVMEMPSYKWPSPRTVAFRMLDRGGAFVRRAGTLIVAVTILVWAALYFPHDLTDEGRQLVERREALESTLAETDPAAAEAADLEDQIAELDNRIVGDQQRHSYLGRAGHVVEPLFRPLGWDWRISCAALASFPAREVVVSTLGVIYDVGGEVDDDEQLTRLQTSLKNATWDGSDEPVYGVPVALSIMVFFALCAQCVSTLVVIRRETNGWRWPAFVFGYMTVLAYLGAMVAYQVSRLFV
ncbi:MAG: ferrous iron transport protein B [Planctomycetales bacterium]|nr:ferrous iron transport protein B [Planctomycetales bacterium]